MKNYLIPALLLTSLTGFAQEAAVNKQTGSGKFSKVYAKKTDATDLNSVRVKGDENKPNRIIVGSKQEAEAANRVPGTMNSVNATVPTGDTKTKGQKR